MKLIFPFLFVIFFTWTKVPAEAAGDDRWCYKDKICGPSTWTSGKCHTGKTQSPIDINPSYSIKGRSTKRMRFNKEYMDAHEKFIVKNNGHTLQVSLNEQLSSSLMMDGDGMRGSYVFAQMHFHWGSRNDVGSEHTVGGVPYTAELHLVHYHERYDSLAAAVHDNNPRALTVLGIFLNIAKDDNPALKSIIEAIKSVEKVADSVVVHLPMNVSALLPRDLGLFRYEGSLTTPACAEIVLWNVFRHPITISQAQIDAFRNMKDDHEDVLVDNYRPTQITNNRRVFEYDHERFEIKPGSNEIDDKKPLDDSNDDGHDVGHVPPAGPPKTNTTSKGSHQSHGGSGAFKLKAGAAAFFSFIFTSLAYLFMFLECFITSLFPSITNYV